MLELDGENVDLTELSSGVVTVVMELSDPMLEVARVLLEVPCIPEDVVDIADENVDFTEPTRVDVGMVPELWIGFWLDTLAAEGLIVFDVEATPVCVCGFGEEALL